MLARSALSSSTELSSLMSDSQQNDIQTCTLLSYCQGEISQPRKQSVSFVRHGLGFDPWWSGSLRLGELINLKDNEYELIRL